MNIQVTSRHFHGSTELQENIRELVENFEKFNDTITGVHVILDAEKKNLRKAELIINISEKQIFVSAEADQMHKAVEAAILKAEGILKKANKKNKTHRSETLATLLEE